LDFENGFRPDIGKLRTLVKPNTRFISITCPHNPTGVLLSRTELQQIIDIAEENKIYLVVDETYRDLTFANKLPLAASLSERVISVSSVSKAYGLPGVRIGWLITKNRALQELFLAAKEQIFLCNSVVDEEIAYRYLLKKESFITRIRKHIDVNFGVLEKWMNHHPKLEWVKPAGGVVCFPRIKKSQYATFPGPGHWFEMDRKYMRIGFGWPGEKEFSRGLEHIDAALALSKAV
jgi:aspartate/methionine/tyrosine aminotransferase